VKALTFVTGAALTLSGLALGVGPASANSSSTHTCSGSLMSPGLLAGTFDGDVVINGR
jgi:hypothetical protein